MPTFFHKPENALKRAKEFIEVGKRGSALEVLNDVIRSRKHRQKWTDVHEKIMLQYCELCVELQRSSYAKDGLYHYRTICKEVAPNSFEKVISAFLKSAEKRASDAREQSEATVLQEVEDLDAVVTPESLLLSTVSGEGAKERTDRVLLTPWVKFLWESYRNMLELLKNNLVNLSVYSGVAKNAFKFCLNYQRRMEFRKLCDILRNHLSQAEKYQNQQHTLKLDQQEVITGLVDVRFEQLESSIAVDLWQEAFRAIEEIHKLLNMSGKSPKASLLENFYSRQAKVYMMAKNQLFHAAALHKLFVLRKEQKKTLTKDEAVITASQVLLATLSVPIEPIPSEADRFLEVDDNSRDKARRLAALLRVDTPPTRASLMKDMLKYEVLQLLSPELQQLYCHLEVDFDPLHLCSNMIPILESLESQETLKQYVEPLKEITLVRLIKQVSQVYESIELSRLVELAPFATTTDLERVVVETASSNNIQVRIDHSTRSLCFGMDINFSHHLDGPEGPHAQNMPAEVLCNQLTMMSQALQQAVHIISSSEIAAEQLAASKRACQDYQLHSRGDHRKTLQRGGEIETRKEFIENQRRAIDKQKEDERRNKLEQERADEKRRLTREAKEREKERAKNELEEMELKVKQEKVEALKNTAVGKRAFADITNEDLKNMDADVIFSKQLKQIEKEKRDKEMKLKSQEKKVDFFERAKRLVELPLLEEQYEEQQTADKEFHTEQENQKISEAIAEREEGLEASARLRVMKQDEARFRRQLQEKRREKYEEKMVKFEAKLDVVRALRLAKRKEERKERRRAEEEAARKEEEIRLAQQKREEEERKREEEQKKREEEREAERQALLKREQEMEEKMQRRQREQAKEEQNWRDDRGGKWEERDSRRREEEPLHRDGRGSPPRSWREGGGGGLEERDSQRKEEEPWRDSRGRREGREEEPSRRDDRGGRFGRGDRWEESSRRDDRGGRFGQGDGWDSRRREEEPSRRDDQGGWRENRRREEEPPRRDDRWASQRREEEPPRRNDQGGWRENRDTRPREEEPPRRDDQGGWRENRDTRPREEEPPRRDDQGGWRRREEEPPRRDEQRGWR